MTRHISSNIFKSLHAWCLLALCVLASERTAYAQEVSETYVTSDTLQVYFRQDHTSLDPLFRDNGSRLEEFSHRFDTLLNDPASKVRSILIVSGASPEGPSTRNRHLSDKRAEVIYDYLVSNHLADSSKIEIESSGTDWKGLTEYVEESDLEYRDEILDILEIPEWIRKDGKIADGRKYRLMNLRGGSVWRELYDLYFADLRSTKVMIAYDILRTEVKAPEMTVRTDTVYIERTDTIYIERTDTVYITKTPPVRLALKSNLLYDALAIPNIGIEVGLYKGLTIHGSYQNIWLRDKAWTRWYRTEGFEAGINWYINKDKRPFKGHHIGIYGQMVTWDFTISGRGYLAERWAYGGGLEYGYALPVGRRFNIDFEIGIGYLGGNMHEYIPQDGHRVWQFVEPFRWIGPTKAGVTLQWLIGRDNHNERRKKDR